MSALRGMLDIFKRENTTMCGKLTNVSQLYFKEKEYIYPQNYLIINQSIFFIKIFIDNKKHVITVIDTDINGNYPFYITTK